MLLVYALFVVFTQIGQFFTGVFQAMWNGLVAGFNWLAGIGNHIAGFFQGVWDALTGVFQWIANGVTGAWTVVVDALKAFVNGLIWVINQIIGVINLVVGLFTLGQAQIPTIPYLQTGGSIERTGVAVVHAGEQVMNVETVQALHSLLDQMSTQGRAIENKNNTINISAQAFDDAGIERLAREVYKQQLLFD